MFPSGFELETIVYNGDAMGFGPSLSPPGHGEPTAEPNILYLIYVEIQLGLS